MQVPAHAHASTVWRLPFATMIVAVTFLHSSVPIAGNTSVNNHGPIACWAP